MKKKIIKLTESQLIKVIKDVTQTVLKEQETQSNYDDALNASAQRRISNLNQIAASQGVVSGNVAQKVAIYGGDGKLKGYVDYEPEKEFKVEALFQTGRYTLEGLVEGYGLKFQKSIRDILGYIVAINGVKGSVGNKGKFAPVITVIGGESDSPNRDLEPGSDKGSLPKGELAKRRANTVRAYILRIITQDGPVGKNHYPFNTVKELYDSVKIGEPHTGPSKEDQFVKIKIAMNPLTNVVSNAPLSSQRPLPQQAPKP